MSDASAPNQLQLRPAMHWKVLTPFSPSTTTGWIPSYISDPSLTFEVIPSDYDHDRSRRLSGLREWIDYARHAVRAWFKTPSKPDEQFGYLTSFPQLPICLALIKRLTFSKVPIVAWCFNLGSTYDGAKGVLARFASRAIDIFVVHSTAEIDIYSKWLRLPRDKFIYVPLSVEMKALPPVAGDTDRFVLALGTANRDYDGLVKALTPLGYRTIIVSGPKAMENVQLPAFIEHRSGLPLEECHKLSRAADLIVIPLKEVEAASGQVSFLETMMFGRPVVVTRAPGTVDYIEDGETGLLVEPGDIEGLRSAIAKLWNDEDLRLRLGSAARTSVENSSTFRAVAPKMCQVLHTFAAR
ncbi:glycosyltransferase family 4 protein [Bradyrhizobium sp. CB2312]|uniref:glycosyltransferase family 4 protein n=1 Tax=Bradyrhizobium sp. CB2312 TaxID=3039155 RepID=UPI0024B249BA|nr:glycosyltransferase family 4 protein [Bradyrhizobium sp. CB2312]WFU70959.1 glycosyltransferase family 4 protein [Bradyrhizobium sp. CB2312]